MLFWLFLVACRNNYPKCLKNDLFFSMVLVLYVSNLFRMNLEFQFFKNEPFFYFEQLISKSKKRTWILETIMFYTVFF